jgi:hypothetical protein
MSEGNVTTCSQCGKKVAVDDFQKHNWTYHPMNDTERAWSDYAKTGFKHWHGSTYYESYGPYY